MKKINNWLLVSAIGCMVVMSPPLGVEAAPKKASPAAPPAVITVTADYMRYNDRTGDVLATGNVVVEQAGRTISAQRVEGNSQTSDVKVDGRAIYEAAGVKLEGGPVVYNWVQRKGSVQQLDGHINKELVHGEAVELLPDRYVLTDGRVTRCDAEDPHYYLAADRIEIIPGDKMTAHNVRVVLLGNTLYSQTKFSKDLKENGGATFVPKIDYESDNGLMVTQHLEYPFDNRWSVYTDLGYYTKQGFVPYSGVKYQSAGYTAQVVSGELYDNDGYKLNKEVEFQIESDKQRIGDSPYQYTLSAAYGKWDDDKKSSWHNEEKVYIARDHLYLTQDKSLWLQLGLGAAYVHESYSGESWTTGIYDASIHKRWDRWNVRTGYHHNGENRNLFDYNRAELAEKWESAVRYKIDEKNSVQVLTRYDLQNDRLYDLDYSWIRNLHCFEAMLTYREKQKDIHFIIEGLN